MLPQSTGYLVRNKEKTLCPEGVDFREHRHAEKCVLDVAR